MEIELLNGTTLNGFSRVDVAPMDGFSRVDLEEPMDGFSRMTLNADTVLNAYDITEDEMELFVRDFLAGDPVAVNGLKDWIKRRKERKAAKRERRAEKKELKMEKKRTKLENLKESGGVMSTLKEVAGKVFDRGADQVEEVAGAYINDMTGEDAEQKLFGLKKNQRGINCQWLQKLV